MRTLIVVDIDSLPDHLSRFFQARWRREAGVVRGGGCAPGLEMGKMKEYCKIETFNRKWSGG